ncbi:SDR family oxidoreductase [Streptomyces klenkii]|uniref:SDR family oxidoreductase n=1 Tax=Streptomyces klenkii TaxID=1420899 RepID=UPI0033A20264
MGGDLAAHHPGALAVWDAVGGTGPDGTPLHRVVFPPPLPDDQHAGQQERLTATEWAQPALAAHSLALLTVLDELGLRPDAAAGHSLGELIALHTAGAYDRETLMHLSRARGEAMRDAGTATPGAMLAVLAGPSEVRDALKRPGAPEVWIANYNGPHQTVVSGSPEAIAAMAAAMRADGTATVPLAASAAFHSPLVASARAPFAAALAGATLSPPKLDVFSNTDAAPYPAASDEVRARLAGHLTEPVRFTDQVEAMYRAGVRTFVEAGPGTALTALVDRILGDRPHLAVPLDRRGTHGVTALQDALARLSVHGIPLDFASYWRHYAVPRSAGQERPPRMTVRIDGGNYGRRYPPQEVDGMAMERQGSADEDAPGSAQAAGAGAVAPALPLAPSVPPALPAQSHGPAVPAVIGMPKAPALPGAPAPAAVTPHAPVPVPEARPVPPVAAPQAGEGDGLVSLIEDAQRQTSEAHAVFLRSMSEAHQAFLRMSEMSFAALVGSPGAPLPEPETRTTPETSAEPPPAAWPDAPAVLVPAAPASPAPAAGPGAARESTGSAPSAFDPARLEEELLAVVAERTGYPLDMLDLDMELESELGIDSIKRVEILSVLRQRMGELPELQGDPVELVSLRTLREVVAKVRQATSDTATPAETPALAPGPGPVQQPAPGPAPVPQPPPAAVPGPEPAPAVPGRFALRSVPVPPSGLAVPGLGEHVLHVVDGGSGLAALVAGRLGERGVPAEAVAEPSPDSRAVLLLGGLTGDPDAEAMLEVQRAAFRAARSVAPRFAREGGLFVTVQDTGGAFGLRSTRGERAWLGGLAGLVRTLAGEWPEAVVKAIDCARSGRSPEDVADAVAGELLGGGSLLEAGLPADGSRVTTVAVPAVLPGAADDGPGSGDVLVATGGARGVTAAALAELARARRPHLALLGRTALDDEPPGLPAGADEAALVRALAGRSADTPPALARKARHILAVREIRAALAAIEQAGAPVRYLQADIRDPDAVRTALDAVRAEWGPVTGIVHGAGVLADKHIADKTDEQFDHVFGTKTAGLRNLLEATAGDPLRTICLFSSVAGSFGNPGQSDYAMANETLVHVAAAEAAARPDCRVRALAWGPWRGGMVTPALAGHFEAAGVPLLTAGAGARAFTEEMSRADEHSAVLLLAVPAPAGIPAVPPPPGLRHPQPARARVSRATHPQLADHVVGGRAVLPLAQALEWFVAAARQWNPADVTLRDLRVVSPAAWGDPDGAPAEFTVAARPEDLGTLLVELRGADGRLHCSGRAESGEGAQDEAPPVAPEDLPPWGRADVYDGELLFHGPMMRAVTAVEAAGPGGARGTLAGVTALGWPGGIWHTDPAVLDGALQLALIWAREALGHATLPMVAGTARPYHRGPAQGPVTCLVLPVRAEGDHARCHLRLTGQDGAPFADLLDIELVRRPDVPAAGGRQGGEA